jgi:hypothetical protein
MKHILPILLAIALLAACAPRSDNPVNSDDPITPKTDDTIPRPADSDLTRGAVYLDTINLLTMESNPPQFSLALTGNLPTPCDQLRVAVSPPDVENKIIIEVYSVSDPDAICAEVLKPFTENIPLGRFPSGHYTLWVNGEQVAEFDA